MNSKANTLILTTKKPGHYKSYGELCRALNGGGTVMETAPIWLTLRHERLVLVDGDSAHLNLSPLVVFRSLLGRPTVFLSVRTEDLLNIRFKSRIKHLLIRFLIRLRRTSYVSIHYPGLKHLEGRCITKCIYDPQLWDLPHLTSKKKSPDELAGATGYLLVLGALNEKRCKDELIANLDSLQAVKVVFAGRMNAEDKKKVETFPNVILINRYVTDAEILGLYANAGIVYAYYDKSVNRPSGIFGRSLQLGLPVIVRKGGYLDKHYGNYERMIKLSSLSALQHAAAADFVPPVGGASALEFDHSDTLRELLQHT